MWSSYSARDAAQLLGMSESAVRACVRDGLVGGIDDVPVRLSFRDLAALRSVKQLSDAGLPMPKVRRALREVLRSRRAGGSLAELTIELRGGQVYVGGAVVAMSGQLELPLAPSGGAAAASVHPLPSPLDGAGPQPAPVMTADDWFARAVALEDSDVEAAIEAYRRALRLRTDRGELWVNLGRLYAETSRRKEAQAAFQKSIPKLMRIISMSRSAWSARSFHGIFRF